MAKIKPFKCVRPRKDLARDVAALPYDVYNSKEAREVVKDINTFIKLSFSSVNGKKAETIIFNNILSFCSVIYIIGKGCNFLFKSLCWSVSSERFNVCHNTLQFLIIWHLWLCKGALKIAVHLILI